MPFTPAHVAVVLPFRLPFVLVALVAGSVAPDIPYFVRALPVTVTAQSWYEPWTNATTTHGWTSTWLITLSTALALTFAWALARQPLAALTARHPPVQNSGAETRGLPVRAAWLVASAALGIASHLAWDDVAHFLGPLFTHLSSAAGLVAVAAFAVRRRAAWWPVRPVAAGAVVALIATGALTGAVVAARDDSATTAHVVRAAAESGGAALALAACAYVGGWWCWSLAATSRRR